MHLDNISPKVPPLVKFLTLHTFRVKMFLFIFSSILFQIPGDLNQLALIVAVYLCFCVSLLLSLRTISLNVSAYGDPLLSLPSFSGPNLETLIASPLSPTAAWSVPLIFVPNSKTLVHFLKFYVHFLNTQLG